MKLILIRHGLQTIERREGKSFEILSEEGISILTKTIAHMRENEIIPDYIYTSPLPRAQQSADMVGHVFNCPVVVEEALGDDFNPEQLDKHISEAKVQSLCMVGHAPTLAGYARTKVREAPSIGRGCCLVLDVDRGSFSLFGYVSADGMQEFD